jgi:hypothetical protein
MAIQLGVFLKQNDDSIEIYSEIYYLKMTKNKIDKTNCCVFDCNTCGKKEPEACFHLIPRYGIKPKYVYFHPKCLWFSKDKVERRKANVFY